MVSVRPLHTIAAGGAYKLGNEHWRALWTVAAYGIGTYVWSEVALRPLDKLELDPQEDVTRVQKSTRSLGANGVEDDIEEGEEADEPIFIPLGLPRLVEGEFYAGNDPEWQTFIKLSKDADSLNALKDQLADGISEALSKDLRITSRVGKPLKVRYSYLRHEFPFRAPPTYVRSGLELSDDGLKWTSQSLPVEKGDLIWNVLEPFRITATFIRAAHFYFLIKRTRLENYLKRLRSGNNDQSEGQNQTEEPFKVSYPLTLPLLSRVSRSSGGTSALNHPNMQGKPDAKRTGPFQPLVIHDETSRGEYKRNDSTADLRAAASLFLFLLKKSPGRYETPPPGVFLIEGMICFNGPRGQCNVFTHAFFDPKGDQFGAVVNTVFGADLRTFFSQLEPVWIEL
ncbi:hypothetical protein MGYG_04989 [Nannizzia gypsea CBS 118893]|uniref:Uncharacterized protein n=1 Tax=Arthroderma gypseum (strain ATCC MYA-4604 / CBS 118893) TaxID=535722 RepID=E4UXZ3_ARTGP|nr:hypothetical protein MGYG_04989 [Nannizzia gypsea CBS 118893]EFR01986.1 hypothetical protein MGYG_04989 [Nannizzia gypsea CBS 118893]